MNEGASTSINHEHVHCTENGLVKEHVFEIELDAKNPDEISSSPNASASINPEHLDCTENGLQSVKEHVFEIQLDAKNPDEISSNANVPAADLSEISFPVETSNMNVNISTNYKILLHKNLHKILTQTSKMKKFLQIILELKIMSI